jgi:hypothetical protein
MIVSPAIYDSPQWGNLSSIARGIYLYLCSRGDKQRRAFPSITRTAKDMRHDRKTVIAAVVELCNCKLIERTCTAGKNTLYTIVPVVETVPVPNQLPVVETVPGSSSNGTGVVVETVHEHIINRTLTENIYDLYPSKDVNNKNRSTGKSRTRDLKKISALLKTGVPVQEKIKSYLAECRKTKTFLKDFKTLLNNLPDLPETVIDGGEGWV